MAYYDQGFNVGAAYGGGGVPRIDPKNYVLGGLQKGQNLQKGALEIEETKRKTAQAGEQKEALAHARGAYNVKNAQDKQGAYSRYRQDMIGSGYETEEEMPAQYSPDMDDTFNELIRGGQQFKDVTGLGSDQTTDIRNAQYFAAQSPEGQRDYIRSKRMSQEERLYGQGITVKDDVAAPIAGFAGAKGKIEKGKKKGELEAKLEIDPAIKEAVSIANEVGKEKGIAIAELNARMASFPRLVEVADKLSELGKTATYTKAGQAADAARRQLGLPVGQGAIARSDYVSTIDNEVLPLLRETFGAQFTENEGKSLKITLGDPNKSPEEKDAVLRSFIAAKIGKIESLKRQTGQEEFVPTGGNIGAGAGGLSTDEAAELEELERMFGQ